MVLLLHQAVRFRQQIERTKEPPRRPQQHTLPQRNFMSETFSVGSNIGILIKKVPERTVTLVWCKTF